MGFKFDLISDVDRERCGTSTSLMSKQFGLIESLNAVFSILSVDEPGEIKGSLATDRFSFKLLFGNLRISNFEDTISVCVGCKGLLSDVILLEVLPSLCNGSKLLTSLFETSTLLASCSDRFVELMIVSIISTCFIFCFTMQNVCFFCHRFIR